MFRDCLRPIFSQTSVVNVSGNPGLRCRHNIGELNLVGKYGHSIARYSEWGSHSTALGPACG